MPSQGRLRGTHCYRGVEARFDAVCVETRFGALCVETRLLVPMVMLSLFFSKSWALPHTPFMCIAIRAGKKLSRSVRAACASAARSTGQVQQWPVCGTPRQVRATRLAQLGVGGSWSENYADAEVLATTGQHGC